MTLANSARLQPIAMTHDIPVPVPAAPTAPPPPAPSVLPPAPAPLTRPYVGWRRAGNSYAYGHCTFYVANRRIVPSNWGHARNWYGAAQRAGFGVGTQPAVGAIAWTPFGYYGHVALVEQVSGNSVLVSEMNYAGWNRATQRWAPMSAFKYIY